MNCIDVIYIEISCDKSPFTRAKKKIKKIKRTFQTHIIKGKLYQFQIINGICYFFSL